MKDIVDGLAIAESIVKDTSSICIEDYKEDWKNKVVTNPVTGHKAKVGSLPKEYRDKYNPRKIRKAKEKADREKGDEKSDDEKKSKDTTEPEKKNEPAKTVGDKSKGTSYKEFKEKITSQKVAKAKIMVSGAHLPLKVEMEDGTQSMFKPMYNPSTEVESHNEVRAADMYGLMGLNHLVPHTVLGELPHDIEFDEIERPYGLPSAALDSGVIERGKGKVKVTKGSKGVYQQFRKGRSLREVLDSGDEEEIKKVIKKIKPEDIVTMAQTDFLLHQTDRTASNVLVDDEGSITAIDNAASFRDSVKAGIGSVFLPQCNFGRGMAKNDLTKHLSYTSHVKKIGHDLHPGVKKLAEEVSKGGEAYLKENYGLDGVHAKDMVRRCKDILEHGFEKAVEMENKIRDDEKSRIEKRRSDKKKSKE